MGDLTPFSSLFGVHISSHRVMMGEAAAEIRFNHSMENKYDLLLLIKTLFFIPLLILFAITRFLRPIHDAVR